MARILVTGGLGFIGTNLVPMLLKRGDEVVVFDNLSNPSGDLEIAPPLNLVEGDVRDKEKIYGVTKDCDIVIHLAADTRVVDSIADPVLNFEVNVVGSLNILEGMRRNSVKTIVNASTGGAIIGEATPPVREDMAARPASPYGASKLAAEGYCSAYSQSYGIQAVNLRFSNVYGPHSRNKSSVIAQFIKDVMDRGAVDVYGDGKQTRDYLHVSDLVTGIVNALTSGKSGTYQLGSGKPTSIIELIKILKQTTGENFSVNFLPFRPGEVKHTYCDISLARNSLDFNPRMSLENGVSDTLRWFTRKG